MQRATCQICMTPRAWASEAVLRQREAAVGAGATGSHWPHGPGPDEFRLADTPDADWWAAPGRRRLTLTGLTSEQRRLV
jgi:hypothetical protein